MFPLNAWYVIATTDEVADSPFARTVCDIPMVLYRDSQGQIVCLQDYCPHRGAPLSLGRASGDNLMCGYHGLEVGPDGKPAFMPKQRVERFPCVDAYQTVETGGYIFVWPGSDQPNVEQVPELPWNQPEWEFGGGSFHIQADFRLMIDNLMDLTHENYVHSSSIGQPEIDEQSVKTRRDGDWVITERYMEAVEAPPFWKLAMRQHGLDTDQLVDRWQVCRFKAPSTIMIDVGVAPTGEGGIHAPVEKKVHGIVTDFMTPETTSSHFYFWGMARSWSIGDNEVTQAIQGGQQKIFTEDLEVLERQQKSLQRFPERKLLMLDIDAGGVQARRQLQAMVDAEYLG